MILHSIKWRLQLWYGLILVVVLGGFGITAFQLERGRQLRRIDEQLQQRAGVVASALRPGRNREGRPPGTFEPGFPPPDQRPDGPAFDRSIQDDPGRAFRQPGEFRMPQLPPAMFDESDRNGFYYIVLSADLKELARSSNAPAGFLPAPHFRIRNQSVNSLSGDLPQFRTESPPRIPPQTRGHLRETSITLSRGEYIIVGRSIEPEIHDLRIIGWTLTAVGGAILLVGLAGGWWIATRSMRPIEDISTTAVKIAAGDLSHRINVADTENELGRLAGVLNSTFARLDAAFTQQRQFTSDAAHELRTPVSVILTQTQTALNRERTAPEYKDTVEACQRAAQRMRQLTESLLELARLDAGQEQLQRTPFDLSRVVTDSVELIRPLAEGRGIQLRCDAPPLQCVGDSGRLSQVITNLLANAVHYNKDNGEVRVTVRPQDGMAVLTVADSGEGISADDLPRIFERFYRADKSRSIGRAGLGLAICKAIVEAHSGTIEVSSEPGVGATFTVRLPVV